MADGALGDSTALIYAPGSFADTDELVELSRVVGRHDGTYISHLRSEGDHFLEGARSRATSAHTPCIGAGPVAIVACFGRPVSSASIIWLMTDRPLADRGRVSAPTLSMHR